MDLQMYFGNCIMQVQFFNVDIWLHYITSEPWVFFSLYSPLTEKNKIIEGLINE